MAPKLRRQYEYLLEIWRDFHCRDDHRSGFKGRDAILESEGAKDFMQLCDQADYEVYQAVDAMIDSLTAEERSAVYMIKAVSKKWRYESVFADALPKAEQALLQKLQRNTCTSIFFA